MFGRINLSELENKVYIVHFKGFRAQTELI